MNKKGDLEQNKNDQDMKLQDIEQSFSNQNVASVMPTLFLTKFPKTYDGEKTASSTNVAGKTVYLPAEN
jgi:hypothetical protein